MSTLPIETQTKCLNVVVRGIGDVGSAVICRLHEMGHKIIAHENREPRSIRRKMSFCDVAYGQDVTLEGICAKRIDELSQINSNPEGVLVYCGPFDKLIKSVKPDVIVDARINKNNLPHFILNLAKVTIGIGPGFVVGEHCDVVVESCWGPDLGKIITKGKALDPINEPPKLNGIGWERFVRSPLDGVFNTGCQIGDFVTQDQTIGWVNHVEIKAPISGHLRGALYSELSVFEEEKLFEIDPRGEHAHVTGLAERPKQIADGVCQVFRDFQENFNDKSSARNSYKTRGCK